MTDKPKIPRAKALLVAQEIYDLLLPYCERVKIAGSLRRHRPTVGDIEVLYIPKMVPSQASLFGSDDDLIDTADYFLGKLLVEGVLEKRPNVKGTTAWGLQNKLAIHKASGIPVDFFATTAKNWANALFVRTGGKRMNLQVTMAAQKKGWSFECYGSGFRKLDGSRHVENTSEADIFRFCDLHYLEPQFRP